ncbi:MAG: UbiA family prenyltransferase [Dehalococcoidales bacterium]|jgi:protoheme IX farnesyltransferase
MSKFVFQKFSKYVGVLKPRESSLLTFIGVCTAIIAADGGIIWGRLLLLFFALLVASAGANGLTNYLDRDLDSRMMRTRRRALPAGRINPPEKVLPMLASLVVLGAVLAWQLHPLVFAADLVGTVAAVVWRKRWNCVFPQGMMASCAPVLMGWLVIKPTFSWELLVLCLLISTWLPIHLWSVMISHREEYLRAGINYFPMSRQSGQVVKLLVILGLALYIVSISLYFVGDFSWLYLVLANLLGGAVLYTSLRLVITGTSRDSWRLYKLSAFPYLGIIFLGMMLDIWLL